MAWRTRTSEKGRRSQFWVNGTQIPDLVLVTRTAVPLSAATELADRPVDHVELARQQPVDLRGLIGHVVVTIESR